MSDQSKSFPIISEMCIINFRWRNEMIINSLLMCNHLFGYNYEYCIQNLLNRLNKWVQNGSVNCKPNLSTPNTNNNKDIWHQWLTMVQVEPIQDYSVHEMHQFIHPLTTRNLWRCCAGQRCDYWCPGVKTPGHQHPQYLPYASCITIVSQEAGILEMNTITA